MISPKIFLIEGKTTFQSDVPIKGIDYAEVYTSTSNIVGSYTKVDKASYSIIDDSVVFTSTPSGVYLRLVVSTTRSEQLNTPSSLALVAVYATFIKTVAENIDKLEDMYNAITLIKPEYKNADFSVENQKSYLVDTSTGSINVLVDTTVECFYIGDFGGTFTDTNKVLVNVGQDTIQLKLENTNKNYLFVKHNNTFRVYDMLGEFKTSGSI